MSVVKESILIMLSVKIHHGIKPWLWIGYHFITLTKNGMKTVFLCVL